MGGELIRFLIAGGSCFALELAILWSLTELGGVNYLWSSGVAFSVAVAINYVMCVRWVFRSMVGEKPRGASTMVIFVGTSVAGLGINQLCMYLLVEQVGLHYLIAKMISTAVVTVWNFVTKRLALR